MRQISILFSVVVTLTASLRADAPIASYIFPAGGQRGTTVKIRVGGLNLHQSCNFEMLGSGIHSSSRLKLGPTVWFEGPRIPMPASQRKEDYPKDMIGEVKIDAQAKLGQRRWRTWTSQGATASRAFVIGDLPEIVENEIDGAPIPVAVTLPLTINGRIFPREDVDIWTVQAKQGQSITCRVNAARLGSPLDSRLEIRDPDGRRLVENDDWNGPDSMVRFVAPIAGKYQIRIHDIKFEGSQSHVYRLTVTSGPFVERVFPLGGRRGSTVKLEATGQALPKLIMIPIPKDAPGQFSTRFKSSNHFPLDVDDLPEYLESSDNQVSLPAMLNGRISKPGEVDQWTFNAKKGEKWSMDLKALRLDSPLNARLFILDSKDKIVAKGDVPGRDPQIQFTARAEGKYRIRIEERFQSQGSSAHAYRLRIGKPKPDYRLTLASDALGIDRGKTGKLRVSIDRLGGFNDAVELQFENLPKGVSVTKATIPAKKRFVDVQFKVDEKAPIRSSIAKIRAGDKTLSFRWTTCMPTPFKIAGTYQVRLVPRGTVFLRKYRIERNGFKGPLTIRLSDRQIRHLQGVTGPTLTLRPDQNEFDYPLHLPTWMELGRTCRVVVTAVGVVKDEEGHEHVVNFSSQAVNEQIILVAEPGPLSIDCDRKSIAISPQSTIRIPVRIKRGSTLRGPAKLTLITPSHLQGIIATPVTLQADRQNGAFTLRVAKSVKGPLNMPIVIRATVLRNGRPVIAETKLDLVQK